jgi:hypothetical protein
LREALKTTWIIPGIPQALIALAGIADLLAAQAKYEDAIELAAFVSANPKAYATDRQRTARLLDQLKDKLPADTLAAAVERAKVLELDAVVKQLLNGGETPSRPQEINM